MAYDSDHATLRAFDDAGVPAAITKLVLPEATAVVVRDVAVSPSGDFVVAASAQNGAGSLSSVIAWTDRQGRLIRAVRTSPFAAFLVTFASDGTLWAAGRVHDELFRDTPHHDVIRVYDQQGRFIRSLLPSESFAASKWHPARGSYLVSGKDRIGLFSASTSEWVEMRLSGEVLGRWKIAPPPEGTTLMGAGLTSSGTLYLGGFQLPTASGGNETDRLPRSVLFRLNKSDGLLTFVDLAPVTGARQDALLLAAEDESLVYYRKSPRTLDWVVPQN